MNQMTPEREEFRRNTIEQHRELSRFLKQNRKLIVADALEFGNAKLACYDYVEMQSAALRKRRIIESHCPILRIVARSERTSPDKRASTLLKLCREVLKSNDVMIRELGKTIASIRRAYSERCFDD